MRSPLAESLLGLLLIPAPGQAQVDHLQVLEPPRLVDCKSYDRPLFRDLSFQLKRGQRLGITGPNGCGKTTLLRILLDLQKCIAGNLPNNPLLIPQELTKCRHALAGVLLHFAKN